eukprot:gene12821-biopygen7968
MLVASTPFGNNFSRVWQPLLLCCSSTTTSAEGDALMRRIGTEEHPGMCACGGLEEKDPTAPGVQGPTAPGVQDPTDPGHGPLAAALLLRVHMDRVHGWSDSGLGRIAKERGIVSQSIGGGAPPPPPLHSPPSGRSEEGKEVRQPRANAAAARARARWARRKASSVATLGGYTRGYTRWLH